MSGIYYRSPDQGGPVDKPFLLHLQEASHSQALILMGDFNDLDILFIHLQNNAEVQLDCSSVAFPILILWSSRGWILAADALVEHWITFHHISLSFYPLHPRLTSLLSLPTKKKKKKKTPKQPHITTLCFQNQQKNCGSIASLP